MVDAVLWAAIGGLSLFLVIAGLVLLWRRNRVTDRGT
jgi:uncharacterized iron-regulated membrane protein